MIADMKKLLLFGSNSEKSKLMKILHKSGCVEISLAQKLDETQYVLDENKINEINRKLTRLEFAFDFIKEGSRVVSKIAKQNKEKYAPIKTGGMLVPKKSLTFEELANSFEIEEDVFDVIKKFEDSANKIVALRNENAKCDSLLNQLQDYKNVPIALDKFKNTKHVSIMLGVVNSTHLPMISQLEDAGAYVEIYNTDTLSTAISIVVLKDSMEDIQPILSSMEFSNCTLNYSDIPINLISNAQSKKIENLDMIDSLYVEAMKEEKSIFDIQRLYDYYLLEKRKIECEGLTSSTQTSYFMEAWVPTVKALDLDKELESSPLSLAYVIRDPLDDEAVPTYCENGEIVSPYESVTNMFSAPKYKEIDPNPFVAFFFFLFYGMMLSDAGYGLLLTLGAGAILLLTKPKKGQSNLIKIIFMGGISTVFWGIIFGSYFGLSATDLGIWCWFNPIEKPLNMMFLSLAMGIVHMLFGTGIKAYAGFKAKDYVDGISSLCWMFLVLGIGGFAGGKIIKGFPVWIGYIGIGLLVIGLILLMLSGTVGKKGAGKVTGALAALYGIINFFSDLMSYTRLFGLGLATAVIGMVFNEIGNAISGLVGGGFVGIFAIVLVAVIGHTFNMAINALGAYVHNARLQFVEFFGKFYTGGGELFKPLGSEMKYYYINDKKSQEVK